MIEIKLNEGENGYEEVSKFIKEFWEKRGYDDAIINISTSYDNISFWNMNEIVFCDCKTSDVEFYNDWWEGEPIIRINGIVLVDHLEIKGGV